MKPLTLKELYMVQHYLSCTILIHPLLYKMFLKRLKKMEIEERVCLLPITHLQIGSLRSKPSDRPSK